MAPIVLTLLQVAFLLLLYLFVWFTVRAIWRDLRTGPARAPVRQGPAPARAPTQPPPPRPAPRPGPPPRPQPKAKDRGPPQELVVHAAGGPPRVLRLGEGEVTFGRSDQSSVPIRGDSYVSERHARVYRDGERWMVADLGSTNGTYLNKARVSTPVPIGPGDQLAIGETVVEVRK
ncbi:MAG: FHA domain-containing protein [Egibacteraceae bacterium]